MKLTGHVIGLLKEYMHDLVEQARQDSAAQDAFGFKPGRYTSDEAIGDLLAILDDRIESEGVQVGLPQDLLHQMWTICNEARTRIGDKVWLEANVRGHAASKAVIRELTYRSLIDLLEQRDA